MLKKINENFDLKRLFLGFRIIILFILIVILTNLFNITLSRYESNVNSMIKPDVAFYIVDANSITKTIKLQDIVPSNTPYFYYFTVSNFLNNKRSDVDLEYDIEFSTTTNLPLKYELYKNQEYSDPSKENIISSNVLEKDLHQTYFNKLKVSNTSTFSFSANKTDTYLLVVKYPLGNNLHPDKYQSIPENINIHINSRQIIE